MKAERWSQLFMEAEDRQIIKELVIEIDRLLLQKDRYGIQKLPLEFSGTTADLLYDKQVSNKSLVIVLEAYVLTLKGKKDIEIVERLMDLSAALKKSLA